MSHSMQDLNSLTRDQTCVTWSGSAESQKTLESPLDCKEIKPVSQGNQPWLFIGRAIAEAEAPILWPPDEKNQLIGKDDARKDWRQKEEQAAENEMVGQHHWLSGHESEQTPGDSGGVDLHGSLRNEDFCPKKERKKSGKERGRKREGGERKKNKERRKKR